MVVVVIHYLHSLVSVQVGKEDERHGTTHFGYTGTICLLFGPLQVWNELDRSILFI